jgi:ABC-type uncharacterized transport system substrate-binding protein
MWCRAVGVIVTLTLSLLAAPRAAEAQQPGVVRRIGVLMYQSRSDEFVPLFAAFRQGLREAGYVEGQNIAIEWQDARGSHARLPALAADLVRLKVEAIFAVGPQALKEAKSATGALPIVAIDLESDPVEAGYVANLARPACFASSPWLGVSCLTAPRSPTRGSASVSKSVRFSEA